MKLTNLDVIEVMRDSLFLPIDELRDRGFSAPQVQRILRVRDMYNYWLQYPSRREKDVVNEIMSRYGLNRTSAYRDISVLKSLLGDLGKVSKDFVRFQFNSMIMETYTLAKQRGDLSAMAAAADKYAKYNQLDREDVLDHQWDSIVPQRFELTDDPTVIGLRPIPNIRERIRKKLEGYLNEQVEEVRYVDIREDGGKEEAVL